MNLKELRAAALKAAQDHLAKGEVDEAEAKMAEVEELNVKLAKAEKGSSLLRQIAELTDAEKDGDAREKGLQESAATLGDHFAKSVLAEIRAKSAAGEKYSIATPEWSGPSKAASDTQVTGTVFNTPVLTEFDRTLIRAVRPELVLTDLLGSGSISGTAISYFIETGPMQGAFTTVAEGGAKPQIHFPDPITALDSLRKIAGFIKFSDEMLEDLGFVVSEINSRLLYELAKFEETQLIYGDGTGTNVLGLLNRSGIQLMARNANAAGTADDESVADAIFRAITAVSTGSGLTADGIVMNPLDYQTLRLSKDANNQYMGGGFFQGSYGNGGIMINPPVWGLRTVVTPSVAQGTALIGAFNQSATVYRKGGVRVESTNSHASDFTNNLVTVRAEERIALAVRRPAGIVKLALGTPA